jgi:hypothetical protein
MLIIEKIMQEWLEGAAERGSAVANRNKPYSSDGKLMYLYKTPIAQLSRIGKPVCYVTNNKQSTGIVRIAQRIKQEARAYGYAVLFVPDVLNHDKDHNKNYLYQNDRYGYVQFLLKEKFG